MWEYVFGGATIFGLIVAIGSWLNGRATRKFLRELIESSTKRTEELLMKLSEQHLTMIEILKSSKS